MIGLVLGAASARRAVAGVCFADSRCLCPLAVQSKALLEGALYGTLAAALFTLWPLAQAERVRVATLYRDAGLGRGQWPRARYLVALALILAGPCWRRPRPDRLVAADPGRDRRVDRRFPDAGRMTWALKRLAAVSGAKPSAPGPHIAAPWRLAPLADRAARRCRSCCRWGLACRCWPRSARWTRNLRRAIAEELPKVAPSFFVVDIQPDQIADFRTRLAAKPGVTKVEDAPMLRGVITELKDRPAERSRGQPLGRCGRSGPDLCR